MNAARYAIDDLALAYLQEHEVAPPGVTTRQIADALGCTTAEANAALVRLYVRKLVGRQQRPEVVGRGTIRNFWWPEWQPKTSTHP